MFFDIAVITVLLASALIGWHRGILLTLYGFVRLFLCLVIALFSAKPVTAWIAASSQVDESLTSHIKTIIFSGDQNSVFLSWVPVYLKKMLPDKPDAGAALMAKSLADILLLVFVFLALLLILFFLSGIAAKMLENNGSGPISTVNGILGFAFGLLRGVIIVGVLLLILFPAFSLADPAWGTAILEGIRGSFLASAFYSYNPIIRFLPEM